MKFRRRRFIVNTGLQLKITLVFVVVSLLGSIAAVLAFNFLAMRELEKLMWSTHIRVRDTGEILGPLFVYVNIFDFLFILLMLIIAGIWMMKKTRGPIFRITKDVMKVAAGDLSKDIVLRKKDEFQDVADEVNSMIGVLREKFKALNEQHRHVSESIDELKKGHNVPESAARSCASVLENINRLEAELKDFKVDNKE